ncbi:Pls/PosA family non-ribosomal peptide synthetase [Pseudonocardia sp. DLS-67]
MPPPRLLDRLVADRLPHHPPRRLEHFFEAGCDRNPSAVAVEDGDLALTYAELERRANQLAHLLRAHGVVAGSRVGLLLERSWLTYAALLGVLKAGATFVPIDPGAPADRVAYIAENAALNLLLSTTTLAPTTAELTATPVWHLDELGEHLQRAPASRPAPATTDPDDDPICYVIYTSGSSGRPKGVAVTQSSICNFIDVVPGVYDVRPTDRVYQGMTVSFDFSIEEIWPTFAVGATLVVGPTDSRRLGGELADFLEGTRVTVLYCVPTLLATIPRDLPRIRNLLVGGEACPAGLVQRWSRPGRRMLNTYGPTEATVTCTWGQLVPDRPVTIGRPLPTYSIVILDDQLRPVPDGEVGEICVGGPGVALGYVGLPEKTAERFVPHPLAPPRPDGRPGRLYRTGDLGRIDPHGEIVYLGRADSEVKIRGHRVDLEEIENVLLEDQDVESAVAALKAVGGSEELATYIVPLTGPDDRDALVTRLLEQMRRRLPGYMVPAYLDVLDALPMMPSGKVDRNRLPAPAARRVAAAGPGGPVVDVAGDLERRIREVWAEAIGVEPDALSVEADFFTDLGGHSMLAATVVSAMRERGIGRSPAIRDLYANPTVRSLAAALDASGATQPLGAVPARVEPAGLHPWRKVAGAGTVQAAFLYALLFVVGFPIVVVYSLNDGDVSIEVLGQLAVAIAAAYLGARWLLVPFFIRLLAADVRPGRYPLWSMTFVRLWAMDVLLGFAPLPVLSGSPFMPGFLRVLGARIGADVHIATGAVSMPTMLAIGPGTAVGYGVEVRPWIVEDGWVHVAPVQIGADAFVGAGAVLEPGSSIGPEAAVANHSMIGQGQVVGDRERWAGSPSARVERLSPAVESMLAAMPVPGWTPRLRGRALLGLCLLELLPLVMFVPGVAMVWWALLNHGIVAGLVAAAFVGPVFVLTVCVLIAVARRLVLPRTPSGVHGLHSGLGIRKWVVDKLLEQSLTYTNSLYATLYTVPWLRALGAEVGRGAEVSTAAHLDPALLTLHDESFVADMASVGSATFANGRMALQHTVVGRRAFVGNASMVPAGTTMGDDSLVGVHTVPPAGGVPPGTSWLGSPAIYLPKRQDSGTFDEALTFRPSRRQRVERLVIEFFRIALPPSLLAVAFYLYLLGISQLADRTSLLAVAALAPLLAIAASLLVVFTVATVKWCVVGAYRPRVEPLWSRFVRRTEFVTGLYEAAAVPALLNLVIGTPFLPPLLRLFGAHIGKRTWIGTTYLTEFDLVTIDDHATVGRGVSLQTHLFEDRVMKMSTVHIGAGATLGDRAIVLYDAVVGPHTVLSALSLVMKGEQLPAETRWRGIPAEGVAV